MNCHYISDFWIWISGFGVGAFFLGFILIVNEWRLAYNREQDRLYKLNDNRFQEIQS